MKTVFIIPYFGEFPNYFQLFLNSCKYNHQFQWFIITDNKKQYNYPINVTLQYMEFHELRNKIQEKFDFEIQLERPYKLCDYKPAYGYIFEKEIEYADFWGYCDIDLIFGNLRTFLTDEILLNNDKIGDLGHMTIYKNTKEINRLFMSKTHNELYYKRVFQDNHGYIFDERYEYSINEIFIEQEKRCYTANICADIYTKSSNFRNVYYNKDHIKIIEDTSNPLYVWDHGHLKRYEEINGSLKKQEFAYIHLQKRNMKIKILLSDEYYKIIPNVFDKMEYMDIDLERYRKEKKKYLNLFYFKIRFKNLKVKLGKIWNKVKS